MSGEIAIPQRRIDNGAPDHLRIELVSSVFALADNDEVPRSKPSITECLELSASSPPLSRKAEWPPVQQLHHEESTTCKTTLFVTTCFGIGTSLYEPRL